MAAQPQEQMCQLKSSQDIYKLSNTGHQEGCLILQEAGRKNDRSVKIGGFQGIYVHFLAVGF